MEAGAAALGAGQHGGLAGPGSMLGIVALVGAARAFEGPTMAALMRGWAAAGHPAGGGVG